MRSASPILQENASYFTYKIRLSVSTSPFRMVFNKTQLLYLLIR